MEFNESHRGRLRAIFESALKVVNGRRCVEQYLAEHEIVGDVYLLAIGKAATAMAEGAVKILGPQIKNNLVITHQKQNSAKSSIKLNIFQAAHPIPDERSIEAGRLLLGFVDDIPVQGKLLCLISGGTSALVEVLPEGVGIEQLQELNNWLLKSGLAIGEINAIRKRVSLIKGGRLATRLNQLQITALLISDVKGDKPAEIGSGLLLPPTENDLAIQAINYPQHISQLINRSPHMPSQDDPVFKQITVSLVANLDKAKEAACRCAIEKKYDVIMHQDYLQGDAIEAGIAITNVIKHAPKKLHIWGGECTMKLPVNPGVGGRCQSLALSAAIAMGDKTDWCLLAAGTDGSDGTQGVAGACVDELTLVKAGLNIAQVKEYLNCADAGSYLKKTDDLIMTGETGTNVTDLVLAYCD